MQNWESGHSDFPSHAFPMPQIWFQEEKSLMLFAFRFSAHVDSLN